MCDIVEVDERGHHGYHEELGRLMQLYRDANCKPIRVWRFNPDGYTNSHGEKITSTFKNGEFTPDCQKRVEFLITEMDKVLFVIPDQPIMVIYLFYSEVKVRELRSLEDVEFSILNN
jgi:hypothetical protein